jgi:hypothetical protein
MGEGLKLPRDDPAIIWQSRELHWGTEKNHFLITLSPICSFVTPRAWVFYLTSRHQYHPQFGIWEVWAKVLTTQVAGAHGAELLQLSPSSPLRHTASTLRSTLAPISYSIFFFTHSPTPLPPVSRITFSNHDNSDMWLIHVPFVTWWSGTL